MADTPTNPSEPTSPASPAVTPPPRRVGSTTGPAAKGQKKAALEELDLATGIDRIPELWARHGNKVLIAITIAALAYAFWNFRRTNALNDREVALDSLARTRDLVQNLRTRPLSMMSPEQYSSLRKQSLSDGTSLLDAVHEKSEDPTLLVQALLLRGDLNYTLALTPDRAEATTRPDLKLPQDNTRLIGAAKESYSRVLSEHPTRTVEVTAARLGLAAIAEDANDLPAAKTQYEAISNDAAAPETFKILAKNALTRLPELEKPIKIIATSQPATPPPGIPFLTPETPFTPPTTAPATPPTTRP